jgi:hypothetical protein
LGELKEVFWFPRVPIGPLASKDIWKIFPSAHCHCEIELKVGIVGIMSDLSKPVVDQFGLG